MKKAILTFLLLIVLGLAACAAPAADGSQDEAQAQQEAQEPTIGLDTADEEVQEEELFDESEFEDDFANW